MHKQQNRLLNRYSLVFLNVFCYDVCVDNCTNICVIL